MSKFINVSLEPNETSLYNMNIEERSRFDIIYVGRTCPDPAYSIQRAGAASHAIEYILSGTGSLITNGKKIRIEKGDCIVLKERSCFTIKSDPKNPFDKVWICVRGRLANRLFEAYDFYDDVYVTHTDISDDIDKIQRTIRNEEDSEFLSIIFHSILQKIANTRENKTDNVQKNSISSSVCAILNENVFGDLCLNEIAAKFFISKVQLIRVFKKDYGVTPYNYFLTKKIDVAKELLRNTDLPIKNIGARLSFSDEHYFSRVFKRTEGVSPGKYRKL